MRASSILVLLVAAAIGLTVVGCASQPKEDEASRAVNKPACADDPSNPLHLTTLRKQEVPRDPELEALLNQTSDPRLLEINMEMYETLRSLGAELRRLQQIEACQRLDSDVQSLQAQATPDSGNGAGVGSSNAGGGGAAVVAGGGPNAAGGGGPGAAGGVGGTIAAGGLAGGAGVAANARTTLIRKSSVAPTTTGGGGNGATAQKISAGSDNDIVARRLRKAAEQESDPALKARLWKEYAQYEQGNATK